MARCEACGQVFPNHMQLGAHTRSCRRLRHVQDLVPVVQDPDDVQEFGITLHSLARRPRHPWGIERDIDMPQLPVGNSPFTRDYRPVR